MDLDDFKIINDRYGHMTGDRMLLSVAQQLRFIFRSTDILDRFGGDEFLILMRGISDIQCVRQKFQQLVKPWGDYQVSKSIDAALYPQDAVIFDQLLEKAGRSLYYAKRIKSTYALYADIPAADC